MAGEPPKVARQRDIFDTLSAPEDHKQILRAQAGALTQQLHALLGRQVLDERLMKAAAEATIESLQITEALLAAAHQPGSAVQITIVEPSLLHGGTDQVVIGPIGAYFDLAEAKSPDQLMTALSLWGVLTSAVSRALLRYQGKMATFKIVRTETPTTSAGNGQSEN